MNVKVVSWHFLEDILGWAVVLVASIVLFFVDVPIIDPILSV
jgi:cobalt-zinc-cadmium efflux system protein